MVLPVATMVPLAPGKGFQNFPKISQKNGANFEVQMKKNEQKIEVQMEKKLVTQSICRRHFLGKNVYQRTLFAQIVSQVSQKKSILMPECLGDSRMDSRHTKAGPGFTMKCSGVHNGGFKQGRESDHDCDHTATIIFNGG